MDQRVEVFTRRPPYVYDLPQDILATLERNVNTAKDANKRDEVEQKKVLDAKRRPEFSTATSSACSLCSLTFSSVEGQRSHIRSDLHRFNLKRRLKGLSAISEDDFESLVGDLDESLSGSDSSESEDGEEENRKDILSDLLKKQAAIAGQDGGSREIVIPKKQKRESGMPPLIWFTTPLLPSDVRIGIYRALFATSEIENQELIVETIRKKQLPPIPVSSAPTDLESGRPPSQSYSGPHMFLCMIGGGHFAAMVVALTSKRTQVSSMGPLAREATVIAHKTFHRYTTRRKQGGSQSANDSAKGAAHSAGSSLRRYNEVALVDEVRLLLAEWKDLIDSSELIFVRATGNTNRKTLFGPYIGQVLWQSDPRLRGFPFSTRRATQNELMRSFLELTRLKVQRIDEIPAGTDMPAAEEQKASQKSSLTVSQRSEEQDTAILHTTQIQALIRRSKLPALFSYLQSNSLSADYHFYPEDSQHNHHASTLLHLAASQNSPTLVSGLLIKAGANPTLVNGDSKPAFDLAGDRATRDAFRVARSSIGEAKWNWDAAHVPPGLSKLEAEQRDERERNEMAHKEEERRKFEAERLHLEDPQIGNSTPIGKAARKGRALALGHMQKTARDKRDEEARGLTPEMRVKLEREQRARAAEERIKRLQSGA